ncbi:MAG: hypothetical protein ACFFCI_02335 [Promethearchaeota archaeon]
MNVLTRSRDGKGRFVKEENIPRSVVMRVTEEEQIQVLLSRL